MKTGGIRISGEDSLYIDQLRGISISRVVLGHLGLFWLFPPYTQFFHALLPLLFFISGGVSYFSFQRAGSAGVYLARRLARLFAPFYLVALIAFGALWRYPEEIPEMSPGDLLLWLTLNPPPETMPFPLGQVWFLHALAAITLISPVIFSAMDRNIRIVPWLIGLSLVIGFWRILSPIHRELYFLGHNFYQPVVSAGFFFFGALVYSRKGRFGPRILWLIVLAGIIVAAGLVISFNFSINLADHAYKPDLYYLALGYAAIALMLATQPFWTLVFRRLPWLNRPLLFVSRHAYSIFLLHSFFILVAEKWLGLVGVAGDPLRAAAKIVFVLAATAVAAVPLSHLSRLCVLQVDALLMRRQQEPELVPEH